MPVEQIDTLVRDVEHSHHQQSLRERLSALAFAGMADSLEYDQVNEPRALVEQYAAETEQSLRLGYQGEVSAYFFKAASSELGPDATEDEVWDKVFSEQMNYLVGHDVDAPVTKDVAANLLVNNLLAVRGQDPEAAQARLDDRMWQIAQKGVGLEIMVAAKANKDLIVASSDEAHPYQSIVEQTDRYGHLFLATSRLGRSDDREIVVPIEVLAETDLEHKAWFFNWAINRNSQGLIDANRQFINEAEAPDLTNHLLRNYYLSTESFNELRLGPPVTGVQHAKALLDGEFNPAYMTPLRISEMSGPDQREVFNAIKGKKGISGAREALTSGTFNNLNEEILTGLLDEGLVRAHKYVSIRAFRNLSTNAYEKLKDEHLPPHRIAEGLDAFADSVIPQIYADWIDDQFKCRDIFTRPDKFSAVVPREQLLELAREKDAIYQVASSMHRWTDGSDKALIIEAMDAPLTGATAIANNVELMPALDTEWFAEELLKRNELVSLANCVKKIPSIDQEALFTKTLESEDPGSALNMQLKSFDRLDPAQVLTQLIARKQYTTIALNIEYFTDETPGSIEQLLMRDPEGYAVVAQNLVYFPDADLPSLADKLIEYEQYDAISRCAAQLVAAGVDFNTVYGCIRTSETALDILCDSEFQRAGLQVSDEQLFTDLLALENPGLTARYIKHLQPSEELKEQFIQQCIDQRDAGPLVFNLTELGADPMVIAKRCVELGWEEPLIQYWTGYFCAGVPRDKQPTTQELMSWGAYGVLLDNLYAYPDTPIFTALEGLMSREGEVADEVFLEAVYKLEISEKLPIAMAERILSTQYPWMLAKRKDLFNPADITPDLLERYLNSGQDHFADFYEYSGQRIDWIDKGMRDFGKEAPVELLLASRELNQQTDEAIPQEYVELGVTTRGHVGIDQLRRFNAGLRGNLLRVDQSSAELHDFVALVTNNSVARGLAKKLVRFDGSEWGSHGDEAWQKTLHGHLDTLADHAPLRPEFVASKPYTIRQLDAKTFDPSQIDVDAQERFSILQADVEAARQLVRQPAAGRYSDLFLRGQSALQSELESLQASREKFIAEGRHEKAVAGIERRIEAVEGLSQLSTREFMEVFQKDFNRLTNLKIKELDSAVRIGVFARALQKSDQAGVIASQLAGAKVGFDSLSQMNNFVEHIVNQEVFKDYFTNPKAAKAFKNLSDTTALRKQIVKTQSGKTSGETSLQFVPSRGLALELSGHLGDACWASKYDSIANEFPNVTAITFLRNPGASTERLVGACLAIDTTEKETGDPVMVIRGVNPIENYANSVVAKEFMDSLLEYAKQVAGNRKVAIVIDSQSGAAGTNRPVIHDYEVKTLRAERTDERPRNLASDSTFNGYTLRASQHSAYFITS